MGVLTKILLRRDTASNWKTTNPTLASGEAGFDTTNKVLKIGDGATAWNTLYPMGQQGFPFFAPFTSGAYYSSPTTDTGANMTDNTTYYVPFFVPISQTFDRIACVTASTFSGTATVRLGIYNNSISTAKPSTVRLDAGTVSCTAASSNYNITISHTLDAGIYWLAMCTQGAATTNAFTCTDQGGAVMNMQRVSTTNSSAIIGYSESGITGAFATAGTLTGIRQVGQARVRAQ